jgi:hypothetical protein
MPKPTICKRGHNNWYIYPDGHGRYCRDCNNLSDSHNYQLHIATFREKSRDFKRHLKMEVLLSYGGKCACCGATDFEFLSIDHINNDGAEHRRQMGAFRSNSKNIYAWLKQHDYPEGFQVLCMNCNCAKAWFGYCPHNDEVRYT